jgi:hypothetical protein
MKTLTRTLSSALLALTALSAAQATTIYTSQAAFLNRTQPGYYLETFDSLPKNTIISSPLFASSNGFDYAISANAGFFNVGPGSDVWLSTAVPFTDIVFNPLTPITAMGGYFFVTDLSGGVTSGKITVKLDDGSTFSITNPNPTSFIGFTTDSPIFSLTVTPVSSAGIGPFATVNDFITGAAVPEGGSSALFLGLGVAAIIFQRGAGRRQRA